jgi:hypothetical protein
MLVLGELLEGKQAINPAEVKGLSENMKRGILADRVVQVGSDLGCEILSSKVWANAGKTTLQKHSRNTPRRRLDPVRRFSPLILRKIGSEMI